MPTLVRAREYRCQVQSDIRVRSLQRHRNRRKRVTQIPGVYIGKAPAITGNKCVVVARRQRLGKRQASSAAKKIKFHRIDVPRIKCHALGVVIDPIVANFVARRQDFNCRNQPALGQMNDFNPYISMFFKHRLGHDEPNTLVNMRIVRVWQPRKQVIGQFRDESAVKVLPECRVFKIRIHARENACHAADYIRVPDFSEAFAHLNTARCITCMKLRSCATVMEVLLVLLGTVRITHAAGESNAPAISYQLPMDGLLPKTWRVTLAIVDPKNPDWIISQFARGVVRTVTTENGGKFTETWDGLDDNFMPVPPGDYAVKGIYMPADQWVVDGEYHSITPHFVTGVSDWLPTPAQWKTPEPFGGDPVGAPLGAVAVGPNGVGVFYYVYLENGLNCPMIDLNKPVNHEQVIKAFPSGGAAGGTSVATDGQTIWAYSTDGGPKFVYRADQKPFGHDAGANRNNVYRPEGWVTAMTAWQKPQVGKSFVYIAQRGKFVETGRRQFVESDVEFADIVTVHDGDSGAYPGSPADLTSDGSGRA